MSKDAVTETLGAHVALSSLEAELWGRVAHGELSADQAAARLLEGREDLGEEEREAIERAKGVFAPVSPERRQAQLEALIRRRRAEEHESRAAVIPMRARRSRRWLAGALAVAASIGLTLWLVPPGPPHEPETFSGRYLIEFDNPSAGMRGTGPQEKIPRFLLAGEIKMRLVPEEAVEGPLAVVAFAVDRSGKAQRLELEPRVHPSGVVEIEANVKDLGLGEGEWELVFAIGREQAMPESWKDVVEWPNPVEYEVQRGKIEIVSRM
jgi:hypothetical protein